MTSKIKMKKTDGPYFGLSADEVTDVSNGEELGTIARYVKDCQPIKVFWNLFHVKILKENLYLIIW